MADANVLLKISADVGNAITGLNSFVELVGKAGSAIAAFAKENDLFIRTMRRANVDIADADKATAGLIDTVALYQQQTKLANAGVNVTSRAYKAMAVAAAQMGKVTGDATGEFRKLTEAVAKGSTRALKEHGIELDNTEDLALAQAEAIAKLTEKYGDASVEVETLSEGIYVLGNNVGTTTGHLWDAVQGATGLGKVLNGFNDNLSAINRQLEIGRTFGDLWSEMTAKMRLHAVELLAPLAELETSFRKLMGMSGIGGLSQAFITMAEGAITDYENKVDERKTAESKFEAEKFIQEQLAALGFLGGGVSGRTKKTTTKKKKDKRLSAAERRAQELAGMDAAAAAAIGGDSDDIEFDIVDSYLSEFGGLNEQGLLQAGGAAGVGDIFGPGAATDLPPGAMSVLTDEEREEKARRLKEITEEQEELFAKLHSEWVERWNINTNMSETWSEAWTSAIDQVDHKMTILSSVMAGFEDVTRGVVSTIAKGEKITVKAVADMVKGVALQIGIEAQVQALMNTAKAIGEAVSSWGASPRVEGFAAAAAAYQATAVLAFGVAAGAGAVGKNAGGGRGGGGGRARAGYGGNMSRRDYSNSMAGRSTGEETTVKVVLEGDADGLFRAIVDKNEQAKQAGEQGIA